MIELYDYESNKLDIDPFITPEFYGAAGDGETDDTTAIQSALNNGGLVLFKPGAEYLVTASLRVKANTVIDLNNSTINSTAGNLFFNFTDADTGFTGYNGNGNIIIRNGTIIGGCTCFAHGENITFENVLFMNCTKSHFMELCACKNIALINCSLTGMVSSTASVKEYINIDQCTYAAFPWIAEGSAFFDGTKNNGITVKGCTFSLGDNPTYAYGYNAVGVHGNSTAIDKQENIILRDNVIKGFTGCGFRINDMNNVIIENNYINVTGDGIAVGDVRQSTNVLIKSNVIITPGTAVTKANSSTVFQATDNDINPTFS